MQNLLIRNRASVWLCFASLIVSAVMMHPSFASVICLGIDALLVFGIRWVSHIEAHTTADDPHVH